MISPTDITTILGRARGLFMPRPAVNTIGTPGQRGFGVGICPTPPAGFSPLTGFNDPSHDNYGNYLYSDGSTMVWVPAPTMAMMTVNATMAPIMTTSPWAKLISWMTPYTIV